VSATATGFGQDVAAHYEAWYESPEGQRADALEKASLGRLLERFAGVESVLEVGSGTGHFARWLREQGLTSVGLDLSAAMLAQADTLDGIPLVRGDGCRLPFADGAFDLVALITTLELLEHPGEVLLEGLRVARQGLLLGVLNRQSLLGLQRRLVGLLRPTVYDAARFYSVRELSCLLRSVAGQKVDVAWHTTLFPRGWPCAYCAVPYGGFIGMALRREPNESR
jgi:ubiquinone/menaquinone biosynthesis C-methylase UbiE